MAARVALVGIGMLAFVLVASWAASGWQHAAGRVTANSLASQPSDASTAVAKPAPSVTTIATLTTAEQVPAGGPPAREKLSVSRQQELLDELDFEIEFVREDIREEAEWAKRTTTYTSLPPGPPTVDDKLRSLRIEADKSTPLITDPALRARLQSDVVDVLHEIEKSRAATHAR